MASPSVKIFIGESGLTMSIVSSTIKSKKQAISKKSSNNQFEQVKPIEVKCFLGEKKLTIETETKIIDATATMTTTIPKSVRKRPSSAPLNSRKPTAIKDMIVSKPVCQLSALSSAQAATSYRKTKEPLNLSETFTLYEVPPATPTTTQSLNETITISHDNPDSDLQIMIPFIVEPDESDSTVVQLKQEMKKRTKPQTLIGRRTQAPIENVSSVSQTQLSSICVAENNENSISKQQLIQQFYEQLEKMKVTFQSSAIQQLPSNNLTVNDGQHQENIVNSSIKESSTRGRISCLRSASSTSTNKIPLVQQQSTRKISSTRIHSAPITMTTRPKSSSSRKSQISTSKTKIAKVEPTKKSRETVPVPVPAEKTVPRNSDVALLPEHEEECRQIYEKLQRLQPDGVCADMNTLRRALYPPVATVGHLSSSIKPPVIAREGNIMQSRLRVEEPFVHTASVPPVSNIGKKTTTTPADPTADMNHIINQMKKHASNNYSYYTRTK